MAFAWGHILLFLASMEAFVYAKEGDDQTRTSAEQDMWLGYALLFVITPAALLIGASGGRRNNDANRLRVANAVMLGMWAAYLAWRFN